jgi:hypothetical protein
VQLRGALGGGRWREYRLLLQTARSADYACLSMGAWVDGGGPSHHDGRPILILRHDVDQNPRSVLPMLTIETDLQVTSTWYFRWRTANPSVIRRVQEQGGDVGLHYETLSRLRLANRFEGPPGPDVLAEAQAILRRELSAFSVLFGPTSSACPHGDTRVPDVRNALLLEHEDPADWNLQFDCVGTMAGRRLAKWLTDRRLERGGWKDGIDPLVLLATRQTPILCLTHPNNWASQPSTLSDRILCALLPDAGVEKVRIARTGSDRPPRLLSLDHP